MGGVLQKGAEGGRGGQRGSEGGRKKVALEMRAGATHTPVTQHTTHTHITDSVFVFLTTVHHTYLIEADGNKIFHRLAKLFPLKARRVVLRDQEQRLRVVCVSGVCMGRQYR